MALNTIGLDWEEIGPHIAIMEQEAAAIIATLKKANAQIDNLNSNPASQDKTAAAVLQKMEECHQSLKEAPDLVRELGDSLKRKSEELIAATDEATRGIMNA